MTDLKDMPTATVEQIVRFREEAFKQLNDEQVCAISMAQLLSDSSIIMKRFSETSYEDEKVIASLQQELKENKSFVAAYSAKVPDLQRALKCRDAELEQLKQGWVSVGDSLPIDFESVSKFESMEIIIVSGGKSEFCEFTCGPRPKPWYKFDDFHEGFITHWMPLPSPPEAKPLIDVSKITYSLEDDNGDMVQIYPPEAS